MSDDGLADFVSSWGGDEDLHRYLETVTGLTFERAFASLVLIRWSWNTASSRGTT